MTRLSVHVGAALETQQLTGEKEQKLKRPGYSSAQKDILVAQDLPLGQMFFQSL